MDICFNNTHEKYNPNQGIATPLITLSCNYLNHVSNTFFIPIFSFFLWSLFQRFSLYYKAAQCSVPIYSQYSNLVITLILTLPTGSDAASGSVSSTVPYICQVCHISPLWWPMCTGNWTLTACLIIVGISRLNTINE